jgi:GGDEF domain-containing protein
MKRGLALLYTVVTVVFFIAVAAVLLFRLGSVRENNLTEARDDFQRLQADIAERAETSELPISRLVQDAFRGTLSRNARVVAFAAYGLQEDIQYLWARNRRILDQTSEETPRFTYDRVSQARLSGSVQMPEGPPLMLEGIYTVLERGDVFSLLRDALIAVLAFALLAVVLAFITLLRPAGGARTATSSGDSRGDASRTPAPGNRQRRAPRETASTSPRSTDGERTAGSAAASPAGESIDTGLFSPQSGLSPEAHLEKRLSLELERAASNDQDLSICFIEYPRLSRGSEDYRQVAQALLEFFGFEDLIFEYGKSSFCVLFPNVDLTEAIQLVEEFQRRALERPPEGAEAQGVRPPRSAGTPAFGLSSRNGRLVEGGRLMREARQALVKARQIPGRVMGFKPDPQRYRRYLSETEG